MITKEKYRITIITERLIRLEWSDNGLFTDESTQMVVNREFADPKYSVDEKDGILEIDTGELYLRYNGEAFSPQGLSIDVRSTGATWHYSIVYGNTDRNLFGTARTLDETDGFVSLENGIFGRNGFGVIDDSSSAIYSDGEFCDRQAQGIDIYFFGYGRDFEGGLRDFFSLCGATPMIPRYALGNWWSRYYKYTADSYRELLDNFQKEDIPLSVAVIDMDWHVTDVDPKYGTGWTGYSWNRELFPDPAAFLAELKKRGLYPTLNLHPADGVRAFEDMYREVADSMGLDPDSEEDIDFDFSDSRFRQAYFEKIMHPYEEDGVAFWWIDWQQGTKRGGSDVDPLFLLNHYHFMDQKDRNKRAMIFSRYAGVGSHRYPVGFSGDSMVTWKSLAFQPYFTSTASNIGYGWWSHDIGGHMQGDRDDERLIRWIQFGVFSPIMRLHSSNSPFLNKEPWTLSRPYRDITGRYMRLRHQLVPYLYTMNYLAHTQGRMLIEPVYYRYPDNEYSYEVKNEYFFGTSLLVGAITDKCDELLRMSKVNMLIPEGRYYDIFTGFVYNGPVKRNLYRSIEDIPVLLKAGGIVPLASDEDRDASAIPAKLRILAGYGSDGSFSLYEDDGLTMEYESGHSVSTDMNLAMEEGGKVRFEIKAAAGDTSLIPDSRGYEIVLYGVEADAGFEAKVCVGADAAIVRSTPAGSTDTSAAEPCYDGEKSMTAPGTPSLVYDEKMRTVTVSTGKVGTDTDIVIEITGICEASNDIERRVFEILDRSWCENNKKERCFDALKAGSTEDFLEFVSGADLNEVLKDALREIAE